VLKHAERKPNLSRNCKAILERKEKAIQGTEKESVNITLKKEGRESAK